MELVDGPTLRKWAEAVPFEDRIRALAEVLEGLDYAHKAGVFHRDFKPSNIVVRASDGQPVLVDFGIAYIDEGQNFDRTKGTLGSPGYIAPEVRVEHNKSRTAKADIYAAGISAYELIAGKKPNETNYVSLITINDELIGLDPIVRKAIASEGDRFSTAKEFFSALIEWRNNVDLRRKAPASKVISGLREKLKKQDQMASEKARIDRIKNEQVAAAISQYDALVTTAGVEACADFVANMADIRPEMQFEGLGGELEPKGLELLARVRRTASDRGVLLARTDSPLRGGGYDQGPLVQWDAAELASPAWVIVSDDGQRRHLHGALVARITRPGVEVWNAELFARPLVFPNDEPTRTPTRDAVKDYVTKVLGFVVLGLIDGAKEW